MDYATGRFFIRQAEADEYEHKRQACAGLRYGAQRHCGGQLLLSLGAQVTITDTKPEADFGGALDELRAPGCVFALGQAADALIAGQDMMIISPGIAWAKPFVQSAIAQGVEVMGKLELGARLTKRRACRHHRYERQQGPHHLTLVGELFRAAGRTTLSATSATRSPRRRAF